MRWTAIALVVYSYRTRSIPPQEYADMRKLILVAALAVLWAASCNDEDPTAPTKPKSTPSVYTGTFDVDFQLTQSDCSFPPLLTGLEVITVDEDDFTWGGMKGTWDEEEQRGYGTSAQTCVPIQPPAGCVGCFVIQFDVTFASPDSFYGAVIVPYDYNEECTATDCSSSFDVTGVRVK
jgi:hypothetical protein